MFCWVHWLEFLWVCLYSRHSQSFCIGEWLWLGWNFHLCSFLVDLLEFILERDTAGGGLIVWICTIGSSMSPCVHFLVWLVGLLVMNSVLHKLNPVRHEIFHLWINMCHVELFWFWYSLCYCIGDICLMESTVFHCWSYVPYVLSIWCLWCVVVCTTANEYSCTRWR